MSGSTVGNLTSQTTTASKSSNSSYDWVLTIYHSGGTCEINGGGSTSTTQGGTGGAMYAVKSNIDANGNILGIVFADSDWKQENHSSTYYNDECSGYHRNESYDSTSTLNGDGTITSDFEEAWEETWDPQGGSVCLENFDRSDFLRQKGIDTLKFCDLLSR